MEVPKTTAQIPDGSGLPTTARATKKLCSRCGSSIASTLSQDPTYNDSRRSTWEFHGFIFGNGTVAHSGEDFTFQEDGTVLDHRNCLRSALCGLLHIEVENMYSDYLADTANHRYRSPNYPYRPAAPWKLSEVVKFAAFTLGGSLLLGIVMAWRDNLMSKK